MSIYDQLQTLQTEFGKYRNSETSNPSFFYFVEHCGNVRNITDKFFEDVSEMEPIVTPIAGNNLKTVHLIRNSARRTMKEQKMVAKATELPISRAWTANGIDETRLRIKKLEQTANAKTESLVKLETMALTELTLTNYKEIKKLMVSGLRGRMKNPKLSIESLIPVKYRIFVDKKDVAVMDMLLKFISDDVDEQTIEEIDKMNYVSFKYTVLMMISALRLTYVFPPNYELYRFCATLPKNPNENSELLMKLEELIIFTDTKMANVIKLAKNYEKYEQYEAKVLKNGP